MISYVCLLRGINVGGRNRVKMADFRALLGELGATDVQTYIQSGNAVFSSAHPTPDAVSNAVEAAFEPRFGFTPRVLVVTAADFAGALAGCPYPEAAEFHPKTVHAFLLAADPTPDAITRLEAVDSGAEVFTIAGRVLYLHTPDGFGTSVLATKIERLLKVPTTARNWRTMRAIAALIQS